ncbi:translation initiation factor IF-1 [Candidatus Dojkabacteria bacterium]|uniref:Translation initiation factor IF-1 n=1 Tax=Candidatus Dojkabacteria bacterium TaxID=2099670 RepID=A0A955RKE5_9BACT|nr:translation initiation factor IF-1 [Candidatus Dojkabacteria bacterium]
MDSKKKFKVRGTITETLPGTKFKVNVVIQGEEFEIMGHLSGKMRMNYIKLQEGDEVDVMISPYDIKKGIIVYRY